MAHTTTKRNRALDELDVRRGEVMEDGEMMVTGTVGKYFVLLRCINPKSKIYGTVTAYRLYQDSDYLQAFLWTIK